MLAGQHGSKLACYSMNFSEDKSSLSKAIVVKENDLFEPVGSIKLLCGMHELIHVCSQSVIIKSFFKVTTRNYD